MAGLIINEIIFLIFKLLYPRILKFALQTHTYGFD
jgi:hypothetical protein